MAQEKFIHQHQPFHESGEHNHTGMMNHLRRLAESEEKLREYVLFESKEVRLFPTPK